MAACYAASSTVPGSVNDDQRRPDQGLCTPAERVGSKARHHGEPDRSGTNAGSPGASAGRSRVDGLSLGVDVGGTFTDLLLLDEKNQRTYTAKVSSTPDDSLRGVLSGIAKICAEAGIDPADIGGVMHGTTVATNTVLTGSGAKVGLVTSKGYRDKLQIARSYVPGGLGGWVIWNKSEPLASLEQTIEAQERIAAAGDVLVPLDKRRLEKDLERLCGCGIKALTVCLFNAMSAASTSARWRRPRPRCCRAFRSRFLAT